MSVRDDVLRFLRDLPGFAEGAQDPATWLAALTDFTQPMLAAANDHALRDAQVAAWRGLATNLMPMPSML